MSPANPYPVQPNRTCTIISPLPTELCRLPTQRPELRPLPPHPNLNPPQHDASITRATDFWNQTNRILILPNPTTRKPHIIQNWQRIDGPGKVLAWSTLPCHTMPVNQAYEPDEQWTTSWPPEPGRISLWLVLAHELGHALGLDHSPLPSIMAPTYNDMTPELTNWEINELKKRYPIMSNPDPKKTMPPYISCTMTALISFINCLLNQQPQQLSLDQIQKLDKIRHHILEALRQLKDED